MSIEGKTPHIPGQTRLSSALDGAELDFAGLAAVLSPPSMCGR